MCQLTTVGSLPKKRWCAVMQGSKNPLGKSRSIGPAYVATQAGRFNNAHLNVHRICRKVASKLNGLSVEVLDLGSSNSRDDASHESRG